MPITSTVTAQAGTGPSTSGAYLAGMAAGSCEPVDLIVVPVRVGGEIAADPELDAVLGVRAVDAVAACQLNGKAGQTAQVVAQAGQATVRVAFLGTGDRSARALRRAGAELARMLAPGGSAVTDLVAGQPDDQVRALAEGILLGSYRYSEKSKQAAADSPAAKGIEVRLLGVAGEAIRQAQIVASAVALARDLANTPSVRKSPQWLAGEAVRIAGDAGLAARVWTEQELAAGGFGGICAVGAGSARPPRLIMLSYHPPGASRHVVLVGKGITFDSGGLSLKPNDGMKAMKTDMAGGGAVIAVMSALASLGVRDRVTGLVAAAENMPSGSAYRPGDVITAFGGRTIEVLNTDAEGRLVLADALAYADAVLAPDQVVDVATLTGAVRVALGSSHAALYSTSDELAAALIEAGAASGERLWRMPLHEEYRAALDSPVADLANISRVAGEPGSITAALFLREFAGSAPWAHLDIAATARSGGDDAELTAGATGFGTRLLLRWLTGQPADPPAG
jgi:leucyl aminopeptidase